MLVSLCVTINGHAQDSVASPSLLLRNYDFVKHSDPWLTSHNAAGLTRYQLKNIGRADLSASYATGGLTDFGGATRVLQADASVEAFYRISRRTVVYGQVSYDNYSGRHATGSAFMPSDTYHLPFDITEDSLTNEGTKHRDTYQLTGAAGIDIGRGISLGVRLDYTAANYAKYKDLRHKNKLMDMLFSAGLQAQLTPWLSVGADYLYHRRTESVTFNLYGREDKVYKSFINYGPFIGKVEQFGNYGLTDKTREMPLADDYNGFDVQIAATILPGLTFYHQLTYLNRKGYYGRKSPYTITYTNHRSKCYAYQAEVSYRTATTRHSLEVHIDVENLTNDLQNYRELKDENDVSYYDYYDPVKTADRKWVNSSLTYTGHYGICHEQPTWTVTMSLSNDRRKQTAFFYPYYRRQNLTTRKIAASIERNFIKQQGIWTVTLNGGYQKGSGEPYIDGSLAAVGTEQTLPATMETYLYQDYHLLTAPQYEFGMQLKYAFRLSAIPLLPHVSASFLHRRANTQAFDYLGRSRTTATITVGCIF